jgi:hypothetical protein
MADDLNPQKRNLMAISVAHIVLYLSGGELDGTSMLGGTVKNADGGVVLVAAWLLYFYFFWMFWRASAGARSGTKFHEDLSAQQPHLLKPIADQVFLDNSNRNNVVNNNHILNRKGFSFYLTPRAPGNDLSVFPNLGHSWLLWRVYLYALWKTLVHGGWVAGLFVPFAVAASAFLCLLLSIYSALIGS